MEATAKAKNLRGSARKARLVLDLIRGKNVDDARKILTFSNKKFALKIEKVLNSALASITESEGKVDLEKYHVAKAVADEGPQMKRYMPRAMGRANIIRKRPCHITVSIAENEELETKVPATKLKVQETKAKVQETKPKVQESKPKVQAKKAKDETKKTTKREA